MKISDIQVTLIDHMGDDLSVVNAARVSFQKESEYEKVREREIYSEDGRSLGLLYDEELSVKDKKLITYLAKHKHFSPFNHAFISMRIKAPVFVARQLVKHKFMPWNEVSRRYVDDEPEFYYPDYWRAKAENVKQGSSDQLFSGEFTFSGIEFDAKGQPFIKHLTTVDEIVKDVMSEAFDTYMAMINKGVAPEQARMVLPQNTMTEWLWSGTLGAYADMLHLRLDPHTQYESRIVAEKVRDLVMPLFPASLSALLENK